ncbi:MAG: hypothetical protein Q8L14_29900 [Myxococcales bacterium]|nr:hypothetical protein [Myxococcales bacterium]
MKNFFVVLALISLFVSTSAWACDDGSPVTTIVGLLTADRVLVREERFGGARIRLYVLDLAKNKVTEFDTILDESDEEADRQKLRASRWKAAETALKKQGLVLKTLPVQKLPLVLKGVSVKSVSSFDSDTGCGESELVAVRGTSSQKLDSTGYCGASDTSSFAGVVVTPDERFVIPMLSSGCLDEPMKWMRAIAVASFVGTKK